MVCDVCGGQLRILADGVWVSEKEILSLPKASKKIERRLSHEIWCNSEDHKTQIYLRTGSKNVSIPNRIPHENS